MYLLRSTVMMTRDTNVACIHSRLAAPSVIAPLKILQGGETILPGLFPGLLKFFLRFGGDPDSG